MTYLDLRNDENGPSLTSSAVAEEHQNVSSKNTVDEMADAINGGNARAGLRGGQRGQLPRAPRCKGTSRDEMYLFQIKCSFEKFRNSEAIQEYNFILYSYILR